MTEIIRSVNGFEWQDLERDLRRVRNAPVPKLDAQSGKQFIFATHFDGTNNDRDNVKLAGGVHSTNVGQIAHQVDSLEKIQDNPNLLNKYYRGVGTDSGIKGVKDALFPEKEIEVTVTKAHKELEFAFSAWHKKHPDVNPEDAVQVLATGFSRGGAAVARFSQVLQERGLTDPASGKVLIEPGKLGLKGAIIYDAVSTGVNVDKVQLASNAQNVLHIQAKHEYREWFMADDHKVHPAVTTVRVMGNHCNVGGSYDRGIEAKVLEASTDWLKKAGLPIADVPAHRRFDGNGNIYHERDMPKTGETAQIARHPAAKILFPNASRAVESTSERADYPVTHDPKKGLDAPRQLRHMEYPPQMYNEHARNEQALIDLHKNYLKTGSWDKAVTNQEQPKQTEPKFEESLVTKGRSR